MSYPAKLYLIVDWQQDFISSGRIDPDGRLDDWYVDEDDVIKYDEEVKSQDDLNENQKYLGEQGVSIDPITGEMIFHKSDGTEERYIYTLSSESGSSSSPNYKHSLIAGSIAFTRSIVTDVIEIAPKMDPATLNYLKYNNIIGRGFTGLNLAWAAFELYDSKRKGSDYARFGTTIAISAFAIIPKAGPFISIGLGIADSQGAFEDFYKKFD